MEIPIFYMEEVLLLFSSLNEELFLKYLQVPCVCFTCFINMNLMDIRAAVPFDHTDKMLQYFMTQISYTAHKTVRESGFVLHDKPLKTLHNNTIPYLLKAQRGL